MQKSSSAVTVKSCLNILRRTPPGDTEQNLAGLASLLSDDAAEELQQRVDPPLKDAADPLADGRPYILCDHNRDGDSHRSPWSNTYTPSLDDGLKPSDRLRTLEIHANEVFDSYRELYYGKDAISSVYLWDREEDSTDFAGCFLIKKTVSDEENDDEAGDSSVKTGYWNSVHVIDVGPITDGSALYKLTTTILISLIPSNRKLSGTTIGGSLTRQTEKTLPVPSSSSSSADVNGGHLINIGTMIEDMEVELRSNMDALYIQKTRQVVESIRRPRSSSSSDGGAGAAMRNHAMMLNQAVLARGGGKKS